MRAVRGVPFRRAPVVGVPVRRIAGSVPGQAGLFPRPVGGLLAKLGPFLGLDRGFLGLVGLFPCLFGRLLQLVGTLLRPVQFLRVGPLFGQFGRFLGQGRPFLRPFGGFLGPLRAVPHPFGGLPRPVGRFLRPEGSQLSLDLRRAAARRLGFAGVPLLGVSSSRSGSSGSASPVAARLATLYGSPVTAMRWRIAVFCALFLVMIIIFPPSLPASARPGC